MDIENYRKAISELKKDIKKLEDKKEIKQKELGQYFLKKPFTKKDRPNLLYEPEDRNKYYRRKYNVKNFDRYFDRDGKEITVYIEKRRKRSIPKEREIYNDEVELYNEGLKAIKKVIEEISSKIEKKKEKLEKFEDEYETLSYLDISNNDDKEKSIDNKTLNINNDTFQKVSSDVDIILHEKIQIENEAKKIINGFRKKKEYQKTERGYKQRITSEFSPLYNKWKTKNYIKIRFSEIVFPLIIDAMNIIDEKLAKKLRIESEWKIKDFSNRL